MATSFWNRAGYAVCGRFQAHNVSGQILHQQKVTSDGWAENFEIWSNFLHKVGYFLREQPMSAQRLISCADRDDFCKWAAKMPIFPTKNNEQMSNWLGVEHSIYHITCFVMKHDLLSLKLTPQKWVVGSLPFGEHFLASASFRGSSSLSGDLKNIFLVFTPMGWTSNQ